MQETMFKVIGCGDAFSSGGQLNACFLVRTAAQANAFLIDCGAGAFAGLKRHGIQSEEIDTILISHFHGDHYGGLPYFLLEAASRSRQKPLTIISPPGCKERVRGLLELLYPGTEVFGKLDIDFLEYNGAEILETDYFTLLALPVEHSPDTLPHGLRISVDGRVISYSGDTGWTPALEKLAHHADLFVCECNFYDTEMEGHLNYQTLMANRHKLTAKQILLTHMDNEMLEKLGSISLSYATEGMEIHL